MFTVNIAKIELNDIELTSKKKQNTLEDRFRILCQRTSRTDITKEQNISHCLRKRELYFFLLILM